MAREKPTFWRRLANALALVLAVPFLLLVLPLVVIAVILRLIYELLLHILIWGAWFPKGKDVLLVYSDSPVWHDYMLAEVLPQLQKRAVVLNWSHRKEWPRWSLAVRAFRTFGGQREYNPLVVVFRPWRRAKVFRFWQAFRDWKHGRTESVERLTQDLRAFHRT